MTDKTNTNNIPTEETAHFAVADMHVNQDLKHSILIVSLVANLIIFTTWIALQVTTQYDTQIASLLFNR
jgi:hypothetical protein